MNKKNTYFVDIDGTIFIYRKFETYETSTAEVIKSIVSYYIAQKIHYLGWEYKPIIFMLIITLLVIFVARFYIQEDKIILYGYSSK